MSAAENVKNIRPEEQPDLPLVHVMSVQIVESSERTNDGDFYTSVRLPSPDGFKAGSSFRVFSTRHLGREGDLVKLKLEFRYWIDVNKWTDQKTGEPRVMKKTMAGVTLLDILS